MVKKVRVIQNKIVFSYKQILNYYFYMFAFYWNSQKLRNIGLKVFALDSTNIKRHGIDISHFYQYI